VRASYVHDEAERHARIRESLLGDAASLFYFFTFDNPELMVKVLDASRAATSTGGTGSQTPQEETCSRTPYFSC